LGVEGAFFEIAGKRDPRDYLLCVSTLHPHKNLERLLRVHAQNPDLPKLIVTGMRGFASRQIERAAGPNVEFTGWIPREELYELFRCARGFVYPSRFEGFGLPVLEAMAAGVPVACSNIPPLREVAGDAVCYFDPDNEEQMIAAIRRILCERGSVQAAKERAEGFTWEKTARLTLNALRAVVQTEKVLGLEEEPLA
jgi:alpha-1,3-rhamnosyl/mannosyltransferase